jgi:hypothetical protein
MATRVFTPEEVVQGHWHKFAERGWASILQCYPDGHAVETYPTEGNTWEGRWWMSEQGDFIVQVGNFELTVPARGDRSVNEGLISSRT